MDASDIEELRKTYRVARLNLEKSERTVGQLARHLARHAIALRLAMIATEQHRAGAARRDTAVEPRAAMPPVPAELADALRELREWRHAALRAYRRIPEAERDRLTVPARPWSLRQTSPAGTGISRGRGRASRLSPAAQCRP
jgi:hypothetical protein